MFENQIFGETRQKYWKFSFILSFSSTYFSYFFYVPTDDKSDDPKEIFYEDLACIR